MQTGKKRVGGLQGARRSFDHVAEGVVDELIVCASWSSTPGEALELDTPILLSALALDEKHDRLHRRPIENLRFPRRFLIVCRSAADLRPTERELIDFLRRRRLTVLPTAGP